MNSLRIKTIERKKTTKPPRMAVKRRYLRDVDGFELAAAEVIRRCAGRRVKTQIRHAGEWLPPPSLTFVTPALVYNLVIGIERNDWNIEQNERDRKERGTPFRPIDDGGGRYPHGADTFRESLSRPSGTPRWLDSRVLDGLDFWGKPHLTVMFGGLGQRHGFEPSLAEFRAGTFGLDDGDPAGGGGSSNVYSLAAARAAKARAQ
jgi:hypothetical protein